MNSNKVGQVWCRLVEWVHCTLGSSKMWSGAVFMMCLVMYSASILEMNPWSWVVMSSGIQVACLSMRGWSSMDVWEKRIFLWSMVSLVSFVHFLSMDPTFVGWESVYHFCTGPSRSNTATVDVVHYCTLTFRWNMAGWRKAISLWNFILSGAIGLQRLCIEVGFGGLLPGEEAIPRECFVSILWRLIPFWLNKWESSFGAECSSILFELPHFALELLVILPCVQIMAGRMRILAHAPAHGASRSMVPDVMGCRWIADTRQSCFWERLRKNTRALILVGGITCLAACNALYTPLYLEERAISSGKSQAFARYREILAAGGLSHSWNWKKDSLGDYFDDSMIRIRQNTTTYACAVSNLTECKTPMQKDMVAWMLEHKAFTLLLEQHTDTENSGGDDLNTSHPCMLLNRSMSTGSPSWILSMLEGDDDDGVIATHIDLFKHVAFGEYFYETDKDTDASFIRMQKQYMHKAKMKRRHPALVNFIVGRPPKDASRFHMIASKHAIEYERMTSKDHRTLVPLVEVALAIMRLSCERWFSLLAVFTSFIIFRDPPEYVQQYIRILATMCRIFQQTIIMTFPAVCWGYGAGFIFSTFASVVFWAGPILRMVERIKKVATEVRPLHWHPVSDEEIERMGGSCAICWGDIAVSDDAIDSAAEDIAEDHDRAVGLACGHAYHTKCILEWLHSCFGQSRKATCPMCQAQVPLHVKYKFTSPFVRRPQEDVQDPLVPRDAAIPGLAAIADQMPDEFMGRFDMPVVPQHGNPLQIPEPAHRRELHHGDDQPSSSSSSSDDDSTMRRRRGRDSMAREVVDRMQQPRPYRQGGSNSVLTNSFSDLCRTHSAHALIIEESSSENSGSSIHLPGMSAVPDLSGSTEESELARPETEQEGSSGGNRRRGPLRGIYARLRPRR